MPRKNVAILFLTFAYAILLGHSIIPHHHHETFSEAEHHHLYEQTTHHHDNNEAHGHDHSSTHLVHDADFGEEFRTPASTTIDFSKQILSLFNFSPFIFSLITETDTCLESKPPAKAFLIYASPHSLSSGLRAPPAV